MNQKLIPVALLLLAGCSETQETSQPEVAQEQQQSQEMQASQTVSQPEVAAEPILAEQELISTGSGTGVFVHQRAEILV